MDTSPRATLPNISLLKESLSQTKKAILLLGSTPNFDIVASALGFSLALRGKGIDVQVASIADMRVEFSRLVGVDQVRKKVGNRNLVVSFDYTEDQVEKVSYQISEDGKRFHLVVAPKTGVAPLQPETVQFEFTGADAQFIGIFGVQGFAELGDLYDSERTLFDTAMTLSATLFPVPPFAKCHLDAGGFSSLCELTAHLCALLDLPLDQDSGSNLLAGIDMATQGFRSPATTAETFETVATLVRAGARRIPVVAAPPLTPHQMPFDPSRTPQGGASFPPMEGFPPSSSPAPMQASTNQFAQLLGSTQPKTTQMPPSMTEELKG